MFLTTTDYKAVCDTDTLNVIQQSDEATRQRAEAYAIEEISSYLRGRFNTVAIFAAANTDRNAQIVMITADVTLYHLVAWLPRRMGWEVRETRYKNAVAWLKDVQSGKATPELPPLTDSNGLDISSPIKYGSMPKNRNDW